MRRRAKVSGPAFGRSSRRPTRRPSPPLPAEDRAYAALRVGRALDSPGHALPAGHREPGQRVHRARLGGAGAARPPGPDRRRRRPGQKAAARSTPSDVVHVHEPFAPRVSSAALRHSSSLNVATFHAPQERVLSTQVARPLVEIFFGRLDARTVTTPETGAAAGALLPRLLRAGRAGRGRPRLGAGRRRAGGDLPPPGRPPPRPRRRPRGAPPHRQAAADRGRPAHAHRPLARLRDAGRGAAGDRPRPRPRRDRDHRPQRGLRGAGGAPDRRARWTTSR